VFLDFSSSLPTAFLFQQTPGVIAGGVQTTGNIIAATPGAFVTGVEAIGNFGGSVIDGLTRPFGK
jgi:hypothetical protein